MEQVNKKFGGLTVRKVSTLSHSALGISDLYFARLKNSRLSEEVVLVLAPHNKSSPGINMISQIPWTSLQVRSYANTEIMYQALEKMVNGKVISNTEKVTLPKVDWKKTPEIELKAEVSRNDKNIYVSRALPQIKFVLYSSYKDNEHGNELESAINLIPAMNSLNFALIKV